MGSVAGCWVPIQEGGVVEHQKMHLSPYSKQRQSYSFPQTQRSGRTGWTGIVHGSPSRSGSHMGRAAAVAGGGLVTVRTCHPELRHQRAAGPHLDLYIARTDQLQVVLELADPVVNPEAVHRHLCRRAR